MNKEFLQKAIEAALRARSPQNFQAMEKFNEEQTDWTAMCPRCKVQLKGTLQQIREHKCGQQ